MTETPVQIAAQEKTTSFQPDESNTRLLRDAFGHFPTGVTIITTATPDGVVAIVASSFSSVSLNPPLALWSIDRASQRFSYFAEARTYAVHVLRADQTDICRAVVQDMYALEQEAMTANADHVPVLPSCLTRFDCHQAAVHDGGDHAIIVGRIIHAEIHGSGSALTFYKGQMGQL